MIDWDGIVAQHGPAVWRTVRRIVGDDADAADCYQEAFLAAVRLARRQEVRSWPALLERLAVQRALDHLRRRKRQRRGRQPMEVCEAAASPGGGPVERALASDLSRRLRAALAKLPARQAEVFCLRCVEDRSPDEVATALGLKSAAVGAFLLHRARRRLAQLLDDSARPARNEEHDEHAIRAARRGNAGLGSGGVQDRADPA